MECPPVLEVTAPCGVVWPVPPCPACLPSCPVSWPTQPHPPAAAAAAVGSLPSTSELFCTLTLFLHDHLGMRQLKASGKLDFIDISQRPSQAPSAFLGRSAPHLPAFLVAVPVLSQGT